MGLSHGYGAVPEKNESIRLIRQAYDMGCTFFDTAEGYGAGDNERLVGEAVKPFRNRIVLATKLHLNMREGDTAAVIRNHLEASLKRLGTDYVDLYYQHRIEDNDRVEEVAGVMGELIKEGKIRGWGQSQATEDQIRRANAVTPLTAIQSEFSMMERMFEKDVIPACEELGIGFVPFSPLAGGAMLHAGTIVLDSLPHGSIFHASAGAMEMPVGERLKLLPVDILEGLVVVVSSTILYGFIL